MDNDDFSTCDHCGKYVPLEDAIYSEGCYFCPSCHAEFKAAFDACEHDWEPYHDEYGDPGRYCKRCCGFVADQDDYLNDYEGE